MTAELRDRWMLHAGIGGLLVLAVAPLTGDLAEALDPLLDKCRDLFAQCILLLRAAGAPLHWIPLALVLGGIAYAAVDRVRVWRKLRRVLFYHRTRPPHPEEPIGRLVREFGLEGRVRVLVDLAPNPAFTVGALHPRILIAEGLQQMLTPAELRAVFRHEVCHLLRRDPLRFAALRALAKTFFWLPLLRVWVEEWMEEAEILADDFAASRAGGTEPLDVASALVTLGRANANALAGMAAIGGFQLLDRRVRRLIGAPTAVPSRLPIRPAVGSVVALTLFWTFALLGSSSAHAMMHEGALCPHAAEKGTEKHCPRCDQPHLPNHTCKR